MDTIDYGLLQKEAQANFLINTEQANKTINSFRLFHGRGKCFSGWDQVNVDLYAPVVHIIFYKDVAIDSSKVLETLKSVLGDKYTYLLQRRYLPKAPFEVLWGEVPEECFAIESGNRYHLTFLKNQNVGFFMDMKLGRDLVRSIAKEKKVLNLFAYTCPFSIAARDAGATSVVNVDMARGPLSTGRDNHRLNEHEMKGISYLGHDIFKSFGKIKKFGPYDIIIMDPPSNQGSSFKIEKDYPRLIRKLSNLMNDNAVVLACINSPFHTSEYLDSIIKEELPNLELLDILYSPREFKELNKENGVKILYYKNTKS